MKKIAIVLTLFLVVFNSFAVEEIRIHFPEKKIKQGRIEKVEIIFNETNETINNLQKLKSRKIGESLYLQSTGPIIKKDGSAEYVSEAKIIVISKPKSNEAKIDFEGKGVVFKWNDIDLELVEIPNKFINFDFTVPGKSKLWIWIISALSLGVAAFAAIKIKNKTSAKQLEKRRKQELNNLLLNVSTFEDVVNVWKNKSVILRTYPVLEDPFKDLEEILFKYQFKKNQTDKEREITLSAYNDFVSKIRGVIDGI